MPLHRLDRRRAGHDAEQHRRFKNVRLPDLTPCPWSVRPDSAPASKAAAAPIAGNIVNAKPAAKKEKATARK